MASRITSKGQVTIPLHIRKRLSVSPGDAIEFVVLDNGTVVVKPAYREVMDLDGVLADSYSKRAGNRIISVDEMEQLIKARAAKEL